MTPIDDLKHSVIMIEDNMNRENVKELYEDAIFLINNAIEKIEKNDTCR